MIITTTFLRKYSSTQLLILFFYPNEQRILTAISRPGYPNAAAAPAANVGLELAKLHTSEIRFSCV
jgi:hypothetical protein